jgi:hypothetical protein
VVPMESKETINKMNLDNDTSKNQEKFSRKERIFAEAIFSETFLEFLEKTTKELSEENNPKNAEIYANLFQELGESIQQLKSENIDARVQTIVFVKNLMAIVMENTSLELKNKERVLN